MNVAANVQAVPRIFQVHVSGDLAWLLPGTGKSGREASGQRSVVFNQGNVGVEAASGCSLEKVGQKKGRYSLASDILALRLGNGSIDKVSHLDCWNFGPARNRIGDENSALKTERFLRPDEVRNFLSRIQTNGHG